MKLSRLLPLVTALLMKISKAAHLMAMGVMQTDLKDTGISIVMISPGRVDTRLMRDSRWTGKGSMLAAPSRFSARLGVE